ncbi:MAG: Polyribonucleotide nucleotidyltransferase [Candidatus Woesebacteria bacterium GW2011_GWB1_38_5b]|uniref:Polyribonucleotide nucleotidyltransferase n=1 Tax=Candidatus Woesebacteria bacterium GW2011_GWB1_38_5b TaxID=1618569 RepID=A0A0G0K795_9BACT|nr:MAG: Polyribonucleotide nucleotidyltransferase [Candidatus Woesebacteria bacterium GW2011_GWB1_38_5b]OGH48178.1 MAG: polyribonucleotide nucleotidyltransferase [Candidatus Levybacteria bacterium RIFCSPLOWO2_01_FULL_39_10]
MNKASVEIELANNKLIFETGEFAPQATSSVLGRLGETAVLVTVVEGGKTDLDYFPLSVEFVERLYAGGKIKGSRWVKREGRPSDDAILAGRVIDRSIRPLFPKEFKNEVQVVVTVLSVDGENDPDIVALNTVSAAIAISRIPWNGPIGAVKVGCVREGGNGEIACIINPGKEQEYSELDLVVSQTKDKTVMIEAGANQIPEDTIVEAIEKGHQETTKIIAAIEELTKKAGQEKLKVEKDAEIYELIKLIEKSYKDEVDGLIESRVNKESGDGGETLIDKIFDELKLKDPSMEIDKGNIAKGVEAIMFQTIRSNILKKKKRPDQRKMDEIREVTTKVGILPRTHGSALFQRGITQALTVVTLGSPRMEQLIESAEGEESKRYIHHYSGLPFSFGQTGRIGTPSRREIGHGALAERALEPVIPSQDKFPYTIRVVSEVLSQNGSSSMASTCGSTLALMDAGVPITKPVAGISIGMMSHSADSGQADEYELLTDIIGLEDFSGDMDFKVAGTDTGVTAIQLDVKIPGLTVEQIKNILERAKTARLEILKSMRSTIDKPREGLSAYAPKIELITIPTDKIGELIGPGGKTIKSIIAQTGATVDVEDDGTVSISATDDETLKKAVEWVKGLTKEIKVGEIYEDGEVKRILPFGAFVEFTPGKEGMVHVSQMSDQFVKNPGDVVAIGDKVKVKVIEIDEQGRVNLTMKFGEGSEVPPKGGERRPSDRNRFDNRGQRGGGRPMRGRFNSPDLGREKSAHPLTLQFRREREEKFRRERQSRPRPYKKTHY